MQCGSCGTDAPNEAVYCPKCGGRLNFEGDAGQNAQPLAGSGAGSPKEKFQDVAGKRTGNGDVVEEEIWQGGFSGKAMIGSWITAGLVTIALIVASVMFPAAMIVLLPLLGLIWLYLGGLLAYRKLAVDYQLTSQRFIHKVGILKQVTDRIEVIDIDDVTVEQGIVQRMVGVGTIHVSSSDRSHPELLLLGIDDVKRVADEIDDVRRRERRSRGLHIEAI